MFKSMFPSLTAALCVVFVVSVSTTASRAGSVDLANFTCGQFIEATNSATKDDEKGLSAILFWVAGYHATDTNGTIVDFGQLQAEFEEVARHCADHPSDTLVKVAGDHMGAEEPGTEAIDLATVTCAKVNTTTEDKVDGLAHILMWLAGYQAGFAGDTVFDADAFGVQVGDIAEYCVANPQIGLYATSEKFMLPAAE